jgi:hypothetical protein
MKVGCCQLKCGQVLKDSCYVQTIGVFFSIVKDGNGSPSFGEDFLQEGRQTSEPVEVLTQRCLDVTK